MSDIAYTEQSHSESLPSPSASGTDAEVSAGIRFKLPVFEGPLDLLLHLIKDNKIDIYDIPIVQITHQYIAYLELMQELNLDIAGDFLVMAATLIHIKSKTLLPPDIKEAEEPAEDPRTELVQRLLEYKRFKDASTQLRSREDIWKNIFHRSITEEGDIDLSLDEEPSLFEVSVFDLISAFKILLKKAPAHVLEITRETLTVSDKINFIMERLEKDDAVRFLDLFEEGYTKLTLIVTFLALLELSRLGLAKAYQENIFGVIWIMNPQKAVGGITPAAELADSETPEITESA
ncbi:MAG: segregation/condensation protein A [Nitrospirae bacterium]|nr:segregation/condensation protein A [Nitrospirota bacterium]